jgi:TonB-linked SusC/RagA family outer membrane protein
MGFRFGALCARVLVASAVLAACAGPALGQERELRGQGPRFLVAASGSERAPVPTDASAIPLLRRRVTVDLPDASLAQALGEIGRAAAVVFAYSPEMLERARRVRVHADELTLAAVLTEVLLDAKVDVLLSGGERITLVPRRVEQAEPGSVSGRVADTKSGQGLVGAEVALEKTRWRAVTGDDGRFHIDAVEAGSYTLLVRRIGYAKRIQSLTVSSGAEATVDVALEPMPTQLNEIVTTVTGEQRRLELGHVVGVINADSLVKEAPVSTVAELLSGRVPGLQVFTRSGTVGGEVQLQVRSPNSLGLGTEPIVLVDGIRYTSGTRGGGGPFNVEQTSRLNDLNPNDIASIEVVKGPSAATLYGTDASNGVIVITTKRGRPGPARWNAYARSNLSEIPPQRFPDVWWGWQSVGGIPSLTRSCTLQRVAQGSCVQDSVTVLGNPLNDPKQTMFGSKPRWEYGANVSGGRQDFRYYVSADFERAIGPIQMPQSTIEQLTAQRGVAELPAEQLEPNAFTKMNLRANVTASLGPTAELRFETGFGHAATRTLSASGGAPYQAGATGTPANPYRDSRTRPEEVFALNSTERLDRFFGSATGQWRPWGWLQARGTVGFDLASTTTYSLARPGETSARFVKGFAGDERSRQLGITGDLGLTALVRRGRLSFRSAVGAQYVRSLTNALASEGSGLPPGGKSVMMATSRSVSQNYSETVTLGSYLEETAGLNDRLFVTGALRVDGASAFGRDYKAAVYPKASVSWIVSDEPFLPRLPGLDELRLRYAFGASGQQAYSYMVLPYFFVSRTPLDGVATNGMSLNFLGNPNLRPERVREHEFGLDATGLDGRLQLGLTWFQRTTTDQILARPLPPGFGFIYTNLGRVDGHGFEAELTARLIEARHLSWQVSLQHAVHRSRLVDLGGVEPYRTFTGGYVEGYPLGARFNRPIVSYADANGNGIIEASEVQLGDPVYVGESTPPRVQTLTTVVGLFQQRLRLSALVERRAGFTQISELSSQQCARERCRAAVDPSTPLAEQAAAVVASSAPPIEPGDFTRLREVTASLDLPAGLVRAVRLRSATLSVAVRNLALWKSFSGPDPESAPVSGWQGGTASEIPQSRSWVFRLDLGL